MTRWHRSRFPLLLSAVVILLAISTVVGPSLPGLSSRVVPASVGAPTGSAASLASLEAASRAPVDSLSGAPASAVMTGGYFGDASVFVTFGLTNASELDVLLSELSNPQSPQYHRYLTESGFVALFSPPAVPYAEAQTYFGSFADLHVTSYSDRIGMLVQGPAAAMESAFGVTLASYFSEGRGTYYAPLGTPTLPGPIAASVVQLEGLSSYLDAQTMLAGAAAWPNASEVPSTVNGYPAPQNCAGAQCLYGSDLQVAYDEQALLSIARPTQEQIATILWAGCTISTTGTCPTADLTGGYDPNDVDTYFNDTIPAGQPHSTVIGAPFDGAPMPGVNASYDVSGAVFENTIDVDMAGSLAPGSTVYNVYGVSSLDSETDAAMGYILNNLPDVNVVSNSWGGQDHVDAAWSTYMETAAARGVTVLASSGDAGDSQFSSRWEGSNTEFPSSVGFDTYGVVGVGGTTLTVDANGFPVDQFLHIVSETTWYDGVYSGGSDQIGSSGGISTWYAEPSWQLTSEANTVIQQAGGAGQRGVPDIAGLANNTIIYLSTNGGSPQVFWVWGTSVAAPATAGMFAEIDAVLAHYAEPALGFVDPALYQWGDAMAQSFVNTTTTGYIFTTSWGTPLPNPPMNDVTTGGNFVYSALRGYDLVTGWGSLDAYNFTIYVLNYNYSGTNFSLNGVESVLSMNGLNVTSPGVAFNASVQQNFFLANSLGAPIYWVQNVIYIAGSPATGWAVNYTGWVNFPFYGLYPAQAVYEYNFPLSGSVVTTPITWTIRSWLTNNGPNPVMNFAINSQTLTLAVPGAAFIIGGYNYQYYWQGETYSNGPFPDNPAPGGLAPQIGLVGGPAFGQGNFQAGTSGSLVSSVEMSGHSNFIPTPRGASFGTSVDQTGELAYNLAWTGSGANWNVDVVSGANDQGVVSYTTVDAGNPADLTPTSFGVNFTETGLLAGTNWSVAFNGVLETCAVGASSSTCAASAILFTATNGIYAFATNATGYSATPSSGNLTVNGGPVTEPIVFASAVTYTVTFAETGLTGAVSWTVILGGVPQSSTQRSIDFVEPNGNYPFTASASDYSANPSSGVLAVSGAPVTQSVTFTYAPTFLLTFTETGLPGSTPWSVTVTNYGTNSSPNGGPIVFAGLSNGNYQFSVSAVSGYTANPSAGTLSVSGSDVNRSITFSGGGGSGGNGTPAFSLFGVSGMTLYITVLVIVAVCVAVAAISAVRARRLSPSGAVAPPQGPPPPSGSGGPPSPPPAAPSAPVAGPPTSYGPPEPTPPPVSPPGMPPPSPPARPPSTAASYPPDAAPPSRWCPRCGTPAPPASRFCRNCGAPLG